jgi:hypothetical protein
MKENIKAVSADKDSPHYREDYKSFAPFLDGQPLNYCLTAHAEEGWVECFLMDQFGPIPKAEGPGFCTIKHEGVVEIKRIMNVFKAHEGLQ